MTTFSKYLTALQISTYWTVIVEKKRNLIALLVTNCQRALPAKFQFVVLYLAEDEGFDRIKELPP